MTYSLLHLEMLSVKERQFEAELICKGDGYQISEMLTRALIKFPDLFSATLTALIHYTNENPIEKTILLASLKKFLK